MTTELPRDDADPADARRVRAALAPTPADQVRATWQDIEARARSGGGVDGVPVGAAAVPEEAANDSRAWRRFGLAAALVLGLGLAVMVALPDREAEPVLRGMTDPGSPGARWLVDSPAVAAEGLARELRELGAEVQVSAEGAGAVVEVRAGAQAQAAVNARLATLETGLDAQGRLRLTVLPAR